MFYQLVCYLHEIDYENIFIDGTKIEANASLYTFVLRKVVNKNGSKMFTKVQSCIELINLTYITNFTVARETLLDDIKEVLNYLDEIQKKEQIEFVHEIFDTWKKQCKN